MMSIELVIMCLWAAWLACTQHPSFMRYQHSHFVAWCHRQSCLIHLPCSFGFFQYTTSLICALSSRRLGKVVQAQDSNDHIPGLYVCGWVKRGPSGIIGKILRHITCICLSSIYTGSPDCRNMTQAWDTELWQTCLHAGAAKNPKCKDTDYVTCFEKESKEEDGNQELTLSVYIVKC